MSTTAPPPLPRTTAERWVERWERQQERYAADRERRFTAVLDLVEHHAGRVGSTLHVLELGCGPGSLTARLAGRLPDARTVAVDADPLLLELARSAHPRAARFEEVTFGQPGWYARLELARPPDVVVSSTTLHYLSDERLAALYRELGEQLRPGAIVVNADHLPPAGPRLGELTDALGRRVRTDDADRDDWVGWWDAVGRDPALAPLLETRDQRGPAIDGDHVVTSDRHVELLRAGGFAEAGVVWRAGPSAVLAAVR